MHGAQARYADGHHMPVLDAANRVIGMVTQADLIAALFRAHGKTKSRKDHT